MIERFGGLARIAQRVVLAVILFVASPVLAQAGQLYPDGDADAKTGFDNSSTVIKTLDATGKAKAVSSTNPLSTGQVKEVCVTPAVTVSNAYGGNYVVGVDPVLGAGKPLQFPNALPPSGGGAIQSVYVQVKKVESMGFTFTPFASNPNNTTWTDAAAAAINAADVAAVRGAILLTGSSVLGTHTTASATQLGQAISVGASAASPPTNQPLYGVLTANGSLTNQFGSTSDLTICVDIIQFP